MLTRNLSLRTCFFTVHFADEALRESGYQSNYFYGTICPTVLEAMVNLSFKIFASKDNELFILLGMINTLVIFYLDFSLTFVPSPDS